MERVTEIGDWRTEGLSMIIWRRGPTTDKDKRFGITVLFGTTYRGRLYPDDSTTKSQNRRPVYIVKVRHIAIVTGHDVRWTLITC